MHAPTPYFSIGILKTALPLLLFTATTTLAADSYQITDLGWGIDASGINNNGDVIGITRPGTSPPPYGHACIYRGTNVIDLGTLGGTWSVPWGINDNGDVVGNSSLSNGATHAFLYSGGTMRDLGTLDGSTNVAVESLAYAINKLGQVVGYSYISTNVVRAFVYSNGIMTDLGALGGTNATATCINGKGEIAGSADTVAGTTHAFLYSGGAMKDLGTLGGPNSGALGINDKGQVTGNLDMSDGSYHGFLYSDGVMTDLGALASGVTIALAYAINNQGQVVGAIQTNAFGGWHGVLYQDGQMFDLNSLVTLPSGLVLGRATAINDQGWIVCDGSSVFLGLHSFLLQPIAQPPSLRFAITEKSIVLSWSDPSFVLQTVDTMDKNAIWTPLTNGVVTSGNICFFTNTTANSAGFFRLQK